MSFRIRPTLIALMASFVSMGAQSAVVGSASSKLENLRVGVIDLNLDDNVAAAVNWQSTSQALTLTPSFASFASFAQEQSYGWLEPVSPIDLLPVASDLTPQALPWATQTFTSANGNASASLNGSGIQVQASLDTAQFNTASHLDSTSYTYDNGFGSMVTTTSDTTRTITGAGNQSRFAPDGAAYDDNIVYDYTSAYFELAPQSLLILQGTAITSVAFDSTSLQEQVANINAQGRNWESSSSQASAEISIAIGLLSPTYEWIDGSPDDQTYFYDFWDSGVNPQGLSMSLYRWGAIESNALTPASNSRNFNFIVANVTDQVRKGALVLRMDAKVEQSVISSVTDITTTLAPIPEPSTYALMGLGLVGIALVRRRA